MLEYLSIKGIALIDELALPLHPGLTVLTGETGAGKSIIVDALQLVLGDKADTSLVRTGEEMAVVEGSFQVRGLAAAGAQLHTGEAILGRELRRQGKGRATVNSSMVPMAQLKALGDHLVDLHGQHEHQSLLKVTTHLDTLDSFAGTGALRSEHQELFAERAAIRGKIEAIAAGTRDRIARRDYLQYVVREIEEAAITPEEESQLRDEEKVLASAEKLMEAASGTLEAIYQSENSLTDSVGRCAGTLGALVEVDPRLGDVVDLLGSAHAQLEEASHQVRDYLGRLEADPARLASINERLVLIADLKKKYGPETADVLATLEDSRAELEEMDTDDSDLEGLRAREEELTAKLTAMAADLSRSRKESSTGLEKRVQGELAELAMEKVRFKVNFADGGHQETGTDSVEYLISPNPGEPLLPLRKIVSGGELSRIMLALKRILAGSDGVPTLVFDEVDTGIGGRVAGVLGSKLKEIAANHQVLCITHLAPVAACADHHILVEKGSEGDRTTVSARYLTGEERVAELARMMGGLEVTSGIIESARELLEGAGGQ
jgi:DNA repair protein RecN (Recombination protein N)